VRKLKLKNKFEKRGYQFLKRHKVQFEYESEKLPYVIYGTYINDFPIISKGSGKKIYIEFKGYLRPEDKRKLVAVKKQHPNVDLRIVFYSHNHKYIKWADKHGFLWAIGSIPKEWINE